MYEFLLNLIYFLPFLFICALIAPILCICEVFSQFLKIYLSIKHKQWIELVDNVDCFFIVLNEGSMTVINVCVMIQGTVDLKQMKYAVETKWTKIKKNGQYKHSILRKHIAYSCGYFYWLLDNNFSIDDHVQLYDCKPPKNQNELDDLYSDICSQQLSESRSPWSVLIFPLDESFGNEPRYVILFRLHHCLGDGFSLAQMISHCILDEKSNTFLTLKPKPAFQITKLLSRLFGYTKNSANTINRLIYFPKFVLQTILTRDCNILHGPPQTGKRFLGQLTLCSLIRVKTLAKASGATVNEVMLSCIAGALKEHFDKNNAMPLNKVHCGVPVSEQNVYEEAGFKNNSSLSFLPLAVDGNTVLVRLKSTQQVSREFKTSRFHDFNYVMFKFILNRLPARISRLLMYMQDATIIISNMSVPLSQCFNIQGQKVLTFCGFPVHTCKTGIGIFISNSNGNLQLAMSMDKAIAKKKDVDTIMQSVIEQFGKLEKCKIKGHS